MFANSRTWIAVVYTLGTCSLAGAGCAKSPGGGGGGSPAGNDGATADSGSVTISPLVISTATRTPRTTSMSVNYWQWVATYGDGITGTDSLVAALKPAFMRVGGYNNDANTPEPFDNAQFDRAVAYARAIGAEPVIQVNKNDVSPRLGQPISQSSTINCTTSNLHATHCRTRVHLSSSYARLSVCQTPWTPS